MKALFLDRDGVINFDKGYVHRVEDFIFLDGIFDLCLHAQNIGYTIFVVTNQAGIGRGIYSERDFLILTQWMVNTFQDQGIGIKDVKYCPDHPDHGVGKYRTNSTRRKPAPGMFLELIEEYSIHPSESVTIGDQITDMLASIRAGVRKNILYNPTAISQNELVNEKNSNFPDVVIVSNLREAINLL